MFEDLVKEFESKARAMSRRELHPRGARREGLVEYRGRKVIDFTSWDLFNLNTNPDYLRSVHRELEASGISSGSSPVGTGILAAHKSCELRLMQFYGNRRAVLVPSRLHGVTLLLRTLIKENDVLFIDDQVQLPIAEIASSLSIPSFTFNISNLASLEGDIAKQKVAKQRFVFADSTSLSSGRKLNVGQMADLLRRQRGILIADETASIGIDGLRGAGLGESEAVRNLLVASVCGLSHIVPSFGAFIAGPGQIFSSLFEGSQVIEGELSLPALACVGIERAVDYIELAHAAREKIRISSNRLRLGLTEIGFLDAGESDSPVVCVAVGGVARARELSEILFQRGYLVEVTSIASPISEVGMIRCLVSVCHTDKMVDGLLQTLSEVYSKLPEE